MTLSGAAPVAAMVFPHFVLFESPYWIGVLWAGVVLCLIGVGTFVEGVLEYRKYKKLLLEANRDPWDVKTKPAEYGPWRPGDE